MIKGKRGEEHSPEQKIVVYVLVVLAIVTIVFIATGLFGGINTIFENIPIFGFNKHPVKSELGLFRYSFTEASKPSSQSVVQYYDGTTWRDFSERNVGDKIFYYKDMKSSFESYFLSLFEIGTNLGEVDGENLILTGKGLGPLSFDKKEIWNYLEINNREYMLGGEGKLYVSSYNLVRGGEIKQGKISIDKSSAFYNTAPLDIQQIIEVIDKKNIHPFNQDYFIESTSFRLQCPKVYRLDLSNSNFELTCQIVKSDELIPIPISRLQIKFILKKNQVTEGEILFITSNNKYNLLNIGDSKGENIKQTIYSSLDDRLKSLSMCVIYKIKKNNNLADTEKYISVNIARKVNDWLIDVNKAISDDCSSTDKSNIQSRIISNSRISGTGIDVSKSVETVQDITFTLKEYRRWLSTRSDSFIFKEGEWKQGSLIIDKIYTQVYPIINGATFEKGILEMKKFALDEKKNRVLITPIVTYRGAKNNDFLVKLSDGSEQSFAFRDGTWKWYSISEKKYSSSPPSNFDTKKILDGLNGQNEERGTILLFSLNRKSFLNSILSSAQSSIPQLTNVDEISDTPLLADESLEPEETILSEGDYNV